MEAFELGASPEAENTDGQVKAITSEFSGTRYTANTSPDVFCAEMFSHSIL